MPLHRIKASRRSFLKGLAVTSGGIVFPNLLLAQGGVPASKKLGIAAIGCDGKGWSDLEGASKGNEVVALCDVDERALTKAGEKYPSAKRFHDFRQMLDEVKEIDAVTVSTADHAHYPAAMHAISRGKHVCVQKPLVNTLWECRELHKAAKKKGVITQMGNQGHTYDDNRVVKEWLAAGALGKIKEIHVWTNRPIWPQGNEVKFKEADVPDYLDWNLWLAATPDHAYSPDIHPFKWRGFIEWGAGAFGDMGCHLIDAPFWGLDLTVPSIVTATKVDELTDIAWPKGAIVKMQFPKPEHKDISMYWYEGKKPDGKPYLPDFPEVIDMNEAFAHKNADKVGKPTDGGWFIVGTEGVLLNKSDQARNPEIWPKKRREEFLANAPAKTLPRSPKAGNPQEEWTEAIKSGKEYEFMSRFDYSVPLTELTLIGGLAMRAGEGKAVHWDSANLKVTNLPDAQKFVKRAKYRKGWEYSADKI